MSNNYWDEEDDELDTPSQQIDADTKGIRDLRKAKKADEARIKELTEKLANLEKAQNERVVAEILEKQGVNTKAARLILKDLEDVNPETVNGWLNENGDLFGFTPAEAAPAVTDADRQAIARQDALTQGALTPDRLQDINYRIDNAQSMDELLSAWQSQIQS